MNEEIKKAARRIAELMFDADAEISSHAEHFEKILSEEFVKPDGEAMNERGSSFYKNNPDVLKHELERCEIEGCGPDCPVQEAARAMNEREKCPKREDAAAYAKRTNQELICDENGDMRWVKTDQIPQPAAPTPTTVWKHGWHQSAAPEEETYNGWKDVITIRKVNAICYELRLKNIRLMTEPSEQRALNKRDALLKIIGEQRREARTLLQCKFKSASVASEGPTRDELAARLDMWIDTYGKRGVELVNDGWQLAHNPASCGHPRACWLDRNYPESERNYDPETHSGNPPIDMRCIMCEAEKEIARLTRLVDVNAAATNISQAAESLSAAPDSAGKAIVESTQHSHEHAGEGPGDAANNKISSGDVSPARESAMNAEGEDSQKGSPLRSANSVTNVLYDGPSCARCGTVMISGHCGSCGFSASGEGPGDERAAFEKWAVKHLGDDRFLIRDDRQPDKYDAYLMNHLWLAWQARAALGAPGKEEK